LASTYPVSSLTNFCRDVLESVGIPHADAEIATDVIMQAERFGVASHGLVRLPHYVKRIELGSINPRPHIQIVKKGQCTALVDGDNGLGHVVSHFAMKNAIELARQGASFVGVRHSSHFGIAGYYALMAAKEDMIGLSFTHTDVILAPYGGTEARLGSNPFAFAAPCDGPHPILLDVSTSTVSLGKIIVARERGETISSEWALDSSGRPTTNPHEARILLPFGGHKGYGLALFVELLCGVLTGSPFGQHLSSMYGDLDKPRNLGHLFGALRADSFVDLNEFKTRSRELADEMRQTKPATGFKEVLVPGDIEFRNQLRNDREGIRLDSSLTEQLRTLSTHLGIAFPTSIV
jgi:ureidoglycolate dehydrogenase (NAD+)